MGLRKKATAKPQQNDNAASVFGGILDGTETLIDPLSGIPIEEQEEILAQINGIAEKNRMSLSASAGAGKARRFEAKKNGGLFPVLVNVLGLAVLAGGFFALYHFQAEAGAQAREGTRTFNPMERALIAEIRRETDGRLAAADMEIARLLSPLAEVESRLRDLPAGGDTPEQALELERLMSLQEELHAELDLARRERSLILDDARSMEMALQAQRDTRAHEDDSPPSPPDAAAMAAVNADVAAARAELERLSGEWAQAAAVEAQVTAFFASAHRQIADARLDEVERTMGALREFMSAPAFLAIAQSRRDLYAQAAEALEALLGEHLAAMLAPPPPASHGSDVEDGLRGEIAELERRLEERYGEIDVLGAGISGSEQVIAQLQSANTQLQNSVASLQTSNATLSAQVSTLQGSLSAQANLGDNRLQETESLQYYIQTLRARNAALDLEVGSLQSQNYGLNSQLAQIRAAAERAAQ